MNQDRYGTNDKGNGEGQGGHNKNNNAIKMTTTMQYDDDNNNNDTNDNWEEKQDLKPAAIDNDVLLTQQQIGDKALQNISGYVSGYDDVHIGEVQESLQRSMVNYDGFCMDQVQESFQRSLVDMTSVLFDKTYFPRYDQYSNIPATAVSTSSHYYHLTDPNTNTLGINVPAAAVSTSSHYCHLTDTNTNTLGTNIPATAVSTSSRYYHLMDTNTNTLGTNIPAAAVSVSSRYCYSTDTNTNTNSVGTLKRYPHSIIHTDLARRRNGRKSALSYKLKDAPKSSMEDSVGSNATHHQPSTAQSTTLTQSTSRGTITDPINIDSDDDSASRPTKKFELLNLQPRLHK